MAGRVTLLLPGQLLAHETVAVRVHLLSKLPHLLLLRTHHAYKGGGLGT